MGSPWNNPFSITLHLFYGRTQKSANIFAKWTRFKPITFWFYMNYSLSNVWTLKDNEYDRGDVISSLLPKCKLYQYYLFHHILHEKTVMTILRFLKQAENPCILWNVLRYEIVIFIIRKRLEKVKCVAYKHSYSSLRNRLLNKDLKLPSFVLE